MVGKANIIKVKYQSNNPGSHWIKVSDANKLRDKACEEEYRKGFRAGIESCKPNKKLDKAIEEATEL